MLVVWIDEIFIATIFDLELAPSLLYIRKYRPYVPLYPKSQTSTNITIHIPFMTW